MSTLSGPLKPNAIARLMRETRCDRHLYLKSFAAICQVVANWADAVLAMVELLPASGKLAEGKLKFLHRRFRPEAIAGMVSKYHLRICTGHGIDYGLQTAPLYCIAACYG